MRVKLKFAYVTLVLTPIKDFSKLSYIFLLLYYLQYYGEGYLYEKF